MDTVLFPPVQKLARDFLTAQLTERGKTMPVGTKNPKSMPAKWIRLESQGGDRDLWEWRPMINIHVYNRQDEVGHEEDSNLVHSLMLDAAGVDMLYLPGYPEPYKWVRKTQHISGPTPVKDDELPDLDIFRIVVIWHVLPIPT